MKNAGDSESIRTFILLRRELQSCKVDCPHGRSANVADLARLDEIVQSLHGLLEGGVIVEAVNLKQIDVVGTQTTQGGVDLVEDGGARELELVDVVLAGLKVGSIDVVTHLGLLGDAPEALGHDDDLFAGDLVLAQGLAHDGLAVPVGVDIGRVPRVETAVVGGLEDGEGLLSKIGEP